MSASAGAAGLTVAFMLRLNVVAIVALALYAWLELRWLRQAHPSLPINPPTDAATLRAAQDDPSRVLFVIVDGLGWREATSPESPFFRDFLQLHFVAEDALLYRLRTQLPSISYPNWISLVSGSSPTVHGRFGNDEIDKEPPVDSLFRQAARYGLKRGMTGYESWSRLFRSTLRPLEGDGTIPLAAIEEEEGENTIREPAMTRHDAAYAAVALEALQAVPPYDFFVAYLSDVDARGHQHGAASKPYRDAVSRTVEHLLSLLSCVDNRTVVAIASDHGHTAVGGHGGAAEPVMEVPFLLYRKGARGGRQRRGPLPPPGRALAEGSSLDVAPTLAAFLGLPPPAHSEGTFLPEALERLDGASDVLEQWRQLVRQKQRFLDAFLEVTGQRTRDSTARLLSPEHSSGLITLAAAQQAVSDLNDHYAEAKANAVRSPALFEPRVNVSNYNHAARLCTSALASVAFGLVATALLLGYASGPRKLCLALVDVTPVSDAAPTFRCPTVVFRSCSGPRKSTACIALGYGALLVFGYFVAAAVGFFGVSRLHRWHSEWRWDFCLFNSAVDAVTNLLLWTLPGTFFLLTVFSCAAWRRSSLPQHCLKRSRSHLPSSPSTTELLGSDPVSPSPAFPLPTSASYELVTAEGIAQQLQEYPQHARQRNTSPRSAGKDAEEENSPSPPDESARSSPPPPPAAALSQGTESASARAALRSLSSSSSLFGVTVAYANCITLLVCIVFFAAQGFHCFLFPNILPVLFVTEANWTAQFQSLSVAFCLLPLVGLMGLMYRRTMAVMTGEEAKAGSQVEVSIV